MKEKLSALMDGELDHDEAASLIRSLPSNNAHRECWNTFHLIGDVMRGQSRPCLNRTDNLFERLAKEPTVLAPAAAISPRSSSERRTRVALAMAASVATISVVSMVAMKLQLNTSPASTQLAHQAVAKPVETAAVNVNDYLAIHRQFSNPAAMQQASITVSMNKQAAVK